MTGDGETVQRDICEALMESQYLAGLRKGWNLGVADDQAGYAAVVKSREGYLNAVLRAMKAIAS